jgi:hypothetical protein
VTGRDLGKFQTWGTSNYVPPHHGQHEFDPDHNGGGDVVWVYSRQMMPLMVQPSGSVGAGNVVVSAYPYFFNGNWIMAGPTGTADILAYKPTTGLGRMVLVALDVTTGNPVLVPGNPTMDPNLTGTADVLAWLPPVGLTGSYLPIAGVRLLSGTATILWENLYDLRPWLTTFPTGSAGGGGGGGHVIEDEGTPLAQRSKLNFEGPVVWAVDAGPGADRTDIIISGSYTPVPPGDVLYADPTGYPAGDARLQWDAANDRLMVGYGTPPPGISTSGFEWIINPANAAGMCLVGVGAPAYGYISGFGARGTWTAPSAQLAGDVLMRINAGGFGGTGTWSGSKARMEMKAQHDWSDTQQGSYLDVMLTASGTSTTRVVATIGEGGDLLISGSAQVQGFQMPAAGLVQGQLLVTDPNGVAACGAPVVFSAVEPSPAFAGMIWVEP